MKAIDKISKILQEKGYVKFSKGLKAKNFGDKASFTQYVNANCPSLKVDDWDKIREVMNNDPYFT